MNFQKIFLILVAALVAAIFAAYFFLGVRPSVQKPSETLGEISLPPGFKISVFASSAGSALSTPGPNAGLRMMLFNGGALYASIPSQGKIVLFRDENGDWKADSQTTFIEGLDNPHGIDFFEGWFYVAEESRVIRVREGKDGKADLASLQVLVDGLPTGAGHFTRTVKVHDGKLFVSIGSSCNVCVESDEKRAAITRCELDGANCTVFARGLRNSVGLEFHPVSGKLYATENGRDWLGDELPPDEINLIEEGKNYGWPICFGKNVHDADFDKNVYVRNPCDEPFETQSLVDLQAHSAPLGLVFYDGAMFPKEYRGNLFVAFHGSWNRGVPTGYKIVRVDMNGLSVGDFATGWLKQDGSVIGRPVDVVVAPDGSLLVSDDNAGKIYRIAYEGKT